MIVECISLKQISHDGRSMLYWIPQLKAMVENAVANGKAHGTDEFEGTVVNWKVNDIQPTYKGMSMGDKAIDLSTMTLGTITDIHERESSCTLLHDRDAHRVNDTPIPFGGHSIQSEARICSYEKFKFQFELINEMKEEMEVTI